MEVEQDPGEYPTAPGPGLGLSFGWSWEGLWVPRVCGTYRIISVFEQLVIVCTVRTSRPNLVLQNLVSRYRTDLLGLSVISKDATVSLLLFCICILSSPVVEVGIKDCRHCGRVLVRWAVWGVTFCVWGREFGRLWVSLLVFGLALYWKVCWGKEEGLETIQLPPLPPFPAPDLSLDKLPGPCLFVLQPLGHGRCLICLFFLFLYSPLPSSNVTVSYSTPQFPHL